LGKIYLKNFIAKVCNLLEGGKCYSTVFSKSKCKKTFFNKLRCEERMHSQVWMKRLCSRFEMVLIHVAFLVASN